MFSQKSAAAAVTSKTLRIISRGEFFSMAVAGLILFPASLRWIYRLLCASLRLCGESYVFSVPWFYVSAVNLVPSLRALRLCGGFIVFSVRSVPSRCPLW